MTTVALTVNDRPVQRAVEPRTHLADFLRDGLDLTGTHLGCEHGVCGACTVLLDGVPARSCITYAVACDGASVTTIEGLEDDEITAALRVAFTQHHALQCGYCTPGMLIAARDLVLRLDEPCERQIRVGLSGNLCRCTGYVGIVRAVGSVIGERRARGIAPMPGAGRQCLGPVGSNRGESEAAGIVVPSAPVREMAVAPEMARTELADDDFIPAVSFDQHFTVSHPPEAVFAILGRPKELAACLPGAALIGTPTPDRAEGEMRIRMGPIVAAFRGVARIERSAATLSGRIVGAGNDARSRSSTRGEIRYRLEPVRGGSATRVDVTVGYRLSGALAQFGRPGLVKDLADRLAAQFAHNLEQRLSGAALPSASPAELNGAALLFDLMSNRVRELLRRMAVWRRMK